MNVENSITYLLTQVSVSYRNYVQKFMNEIGLHGGQVFVLISLWNNDGQSQIDLVKNLNLTSPTINKMIGSLQRNGFVESRRSANDGRIVNIFLTDKGLASKTLVEEQWTKLEAEVLVNLTETEKLILLQIFGKLKENFSKTVAPPSNDL